MRFDGVKKELFVGGDETNGNLGTLDFELLILTFSLLPEDGIVTNWGNKRDLTQAQLWSNSLFTGYGLILIENPELIHYRNNLSRFAVQGIEKFLSTRPNQLETISIYLDGRLNHGVRTEIRGSFKSNFKEIIVDNFPKKRTNSSSGFSKSYKCPRVTYYADSLLSAIIRPSKSKEDYRNHPNLLFKV